MKKMINGVVREMNSEETAEYNKWLSELSENSGGGYETTKNY